MTKYNIPQRRYLVELHKNDIETGGEYSELVLDEALSMVYKANEAYVAGDKNSGDTLVDAAAILIGRGTMGALELHRRIVQREIEQPEEATEPVGLTELMQHQAELFGVSYYGTSNYELMLESAKAMQQMKTMAGMKGVMPPIELWNKPDVLEEAIAVGMHPMVVWSIRTASDEEIQSPLYSEWVEMDLAAKGK